MPEMIEIVDSDDNILGYSDREHIHNSKMWHRGIHILMKTGEGNLILEKRGGEDKLELTVSGHVRKGEKYEEAARRELYEELYLKTHMLEKIAKIRLVSDDGERMLSMLFSGKLNNNELNSHINEGYEIISSHKLRNLLEQKPERFAAFSREILRWYLGYRSNVEIIEKH